MSKRTDDEPGNGSAQAVQRSQRAEGLQRGVTVLRFRPVSGIGGGQRPAEHELAARRAHQLVGELRQRLGRQLAQRGGRVVVVLVLEPGQAFHAAQDRRELRRVALPGRRPLLLGGVLGTDLEEEPHAVAGYGDLEVRVLLVAAPVRGERHPGIVGGIHRTPRVLGDVGERLLARRALDARRQALAQRLELGADPAPDLAHARLEALHVEDLEVGGREGGRRHGWSPYYRRRRYDSASWNRGG